MTDRNHHFPPPDAPACTLCRDTGLYVWDNEWRVCRAPHTEGKREELQKQADGANEAFARLEIKVQR